MEQSQEQLHSQGHKNRWFAPISHLELTYQMSKYIREKI